MISNHSNHSNHSVKKGYSKVTGKTSEKRVYVVYNESIYDQCFQHEEISQFSCSVNQLTDSYMRINI